MLTAAACLLPLSTAIATADETALSGPASSGLLTWVPPTTITEDTATTLGVRGEINGQATGHVKLLEATTPCPVSPLYPQQLATGSTLTVTPTTAPAPVGTTPTSPLGGTIDSSLSFTERDSGAYRLCGWVVARPPANEASTIARFEQPVTVANKVATIDVQAPESVRSGDYFTIKMTGTTPGSGRRALVMAEPSAGQSCPELRKVPTGKRKLQSVIGLASGAYSKSSRQRFATKTAGTYLLCIQVVEATDRNPEAFWTRTLTVTESAKCVSTQSALEQRRRDLTVIRTRRDNAKERLAKAEAKLAPLKRSYDRSKRASDRRIASARRAVARAKTPTGKRRAQQRLTRVRRAEASKLRRIGKPYRQAAAKVSVESRTYKQYRTGANLLMDTISRMKKDTKKYCANPAK